MIDPWSSTGVKDYESLMEDFGVSTFDFDSKTQEESSARRPQEGLRLPDPHRFFRRDIVFGHRDYGHVADAIRSGEDFAVMSGFVPSGEPHLGHKMVMEEIVWHQQRGGTAFPAIADMEGRAVRGISLKDGKKTGKEYLLSLAALGLEPDDCNAYFQSEMGDVRDLAQEIANYARWSEVQAIYGFGGDTSIGHAFVPPLQAADILHPQLARHGGPKPTVIPVGIDQDPHIRLARDLAYRARMLRVEGVEDHLKVRSKRLSGEDLEELASSISSEEIEDSNPEDSAAAQTDGVSLKVFDEHLDVYGASRDEVEAVVRGFELSRGGYGFHQPAATYHRFMRGLTGGKMSSSEEGSYISLVEDPESARKKIMSAKTGGRTTAEEQREKGGEPDGCAVFELHTFHGVEDDDRLREIYEDCRNGALLCGRCKSWGADEIAEFLEEHQEKRELLRDELDDYMEVLE